MKQVEEKENSESLIFSHPMKGIYPELETNVRIFIGSTSYADIYRVSYRGRYFLVKRPHGGNQRAHDIICREYELSAGCDHPNIVHVFTMEMSDTSTPEIWMEYVEGRNLNEFLAEDPDKKIRKKVFVQLLDAIGYLHSRGIVHNDLKPENILVTRSGDNLRLIDFGLSDDDAYYVIKTPGCSPFYAAPELKTEKKSDARSDIYSIGLIMQILFPGKYRKIARRCLRNDKNERFSDIVSLERAMSRHDSLRTRITVSFFLLIIASAISFLFFERHQNAKRISQSEYLIQENGLRLETANKKIADQHTDIENLTEMYYSVKDSLDKERDSSLRQQIILSEMERRLDETLDRMLKLAIDSMSVAETSVEKARIINNYWIRGRQYVNYSNWKYGDIDYSDKIFNRMLRHFEEADKRLHDIMMESDSY